MQANAKIDRYELLASLGQGATGMVYLAKDTKLDREVALKVISPEVAGDPTARSLFHREARAIAKLHHPNIIALHDYSGPDSEIIYLVVERLSGQTLLDIVEKRGKPMSASHAAAAGHEICLALTHAHASGIIHRDVKPENVFLEPDGRVVLCDFGIARDYRSAMKHTLASHNTTLAGSPMYMSPEQVLTPQQVGPASDLFSLGSLLYFLVTGVHAFAGNSMHKILKNVSEVKCASLLETRNDVPEEYSRLVHKLLQRDPEKRFGSARQVGEQLAHIVAKSPHHDPRRALQALLMHARDESAGMNSTTLIPLDQLKDNPRHTMIMLTQKKAPKEPAAPPQIEAALKAKPQLLPLEKSDTHPRPPPPPKSLGVLFWSMIAATSIVLLGLVVAETEVLAGLRAWLQRMFQR
ncbi:MAG: serine/threonine protein kinase [Deltaproteobacteria bacterium]|nr:serine/threonine protein kinase [Deltaproteobacteria bacterium]